jgi:hypothetical protein
MTIHGGMSAVLLAWEPEHIPASRRQTRWVIMLALLLGASASAANEALAQDTLPPHLGGYTRSLGLPRMHHPHASFVLGLDRAAGRHVGYQLRIGVTDPIGSPVTQLLSIAAEGYAGRRDGSASAGVRGLVLSPILSSGAGVDLDLAEGRADPFLSLISPVRRGGVLGRGTHLQFEWYPTRAHSVGLALAAPIRPGHLGRTRPARDHVVMRPPARRAPPGHVSDVLRDALERAQESAFWINRFTVVPMGTTSADAHRAVAAAVEPLRQRLVHHSVADEIESYHAALDRAFSIAIAGCTLDCDVTPDGEGIAARARQVLLNGVLFPYNRLLGQQKRNDTTREFALHARGSFARWLVQESAVPPDRLPDVLHVFQSMLDIVETIRELNRAEWRDSRLVWLPPQLALRPGQYVMKEDLDTLISNAVGRRIVHGNRMWYLYNSRFHQQLVSSISAAEEYHVLWVHDFRGMTPGERPDTLSLLLVTRQYLSSLTQRVAAYDSTGRLPAYMLFLDQHYFELNGSRDLLALLQNPLFHRLNLPGLTAELADTIAAWQAGLRQAIAASRLLAVERAEYGDEWVRRLVKVHVSVTNPADASFRSRHGMRFVSLPDDIMRDHRKAVVYDVSEEDPFRGMAMYAGMGVGEQYASPAWEDRALMLQGPAALALRDAARRLLESHGLGGSSVPHVLRVRPRPEDYDAIVRAEIESMDARNEVAVRAVELHNSTGFGPKEIAVAQATLLSLTSPGAVFKIPDSLWMNELFAALVGGAALRGTRVLPIAPSTASAPAPAMGIVGIHDVFSRLIALSVIMAPEIERSGGLLRPGVYHARGNVDDVGARVAALAHTMYKYPFLRELFPTLPTFFAAAAARVDAAVPVGAEPSVSPALEPATEFAPADAKLHLKGTLYVSQPAWEALMQGPPLTEALQIYLEERQRLRSGEGDERALVAALLRVGAEIINPILVAVPEQQRSAWVFYLQVGSPNFDYRSMLLDGEVAALISDWTSLYAFFDFMLLLGLVEWTDNQASFDALMPPPGRLKRRIGRWIRLGL